MRSGTIVVLVAVMFVSACCRASVLRQQVRMVPTPVVESVFVGEGVRSVVEYVERSDGSVEIFEMERNARQGLSHYVGTRSAADGRAFLTNAISPIEHRVRLVRAPSETSRILESIAFDPPRGAPIELKLVPSRISMEFKPNRGGQEVLFDRYK